MPFGARRTSKRFTASEAKAGDKIDLPDGTHEVAAVSRIDDPSYPGAYRVEVRTNKGLVLNLDPSDVLSYARSG